MADSKSVKHLKKVIKPYGLRLEYGGKHMAVVNEEGNRVGTMSLSPKAPYNAENTIKQLINNGALPPEAGGRGSRV